MSLPKSNGVLTAALLLSLGVTAPLLADPGLESEGIVRVTDGRPHAIQGRSGNLPSQSSVQQTSAATQLPPPQPATPAGFGVDGTCPTCQMGGVPNAGCPHCRGRGPRFQEHTCKHSPDFGYSPPAHYPLLRRGVEYNAYYPTKWYGAGGDYIVSQAPMVYQPTDTTQLGFYYQHVPTWQPRPGYLPPRPIPAQWHNTPGPVPPVNYSNAGWNHGFGGHFNRGDCYGGDCYAGRPQGFRRTVFGSLRHNGYADGEWCQGEIISTVPSTTPTPIQSPAPTTAPPSTLPEGQKAAEALPSYGPVPAPAQIDTIPSPAASGASAMVPSSPLPALSQASEPVITTAKPNSAPANTTANSPAPAAKKQEVRNLQPVGFINKRI